MKGLRLADGWLAGWLLFQSLSLSFHQLKLVGVICVCCVCTAVYCQCIYSVSLLHSIASTLYLSSSRFIPSNRRWFCAKINVKCPLIRFLFGICCYQKKYARLYTPKYSKQTKKKNLFITFPLGKLGYTR